VVRRPSGLCEIQGSRGGAIRKCAGQFARRFAGTEKSSGAANGGRGRHKPGSNRREGQLLIRQPSRQEVPAGGFALIGGGFGFGRPRLNGSRLGLGGLFLAGEDFDAAVFGRVRLRTAGILRLGRIRWSRGLHDPR
jgi:hypothetical protein